MAPCVKHTYRSNNRRSLTLHERESISKNSSLLQSLTSSNVRAQQEQVQKMKSDLQASERKILQDITNLNKAPSQAKPLNVNRKLSEQILPDDINERLSFTIPEDVPSFVASPIIFKETSFNYDQATENSFIIFEKSKLSEFFHAVEDNLISPKATSSSPNKVPGSSDLLTSEPGSVFDYHEAGEATEMPNLSELKSERSQAFASPISDKSISRQPEIEFFTIDPEFLHSFEGIWRRKLDQPIRAAHPESPDHFEQIPMISKGAPRKRKGRK